MWRLGGARIKYLAPGNPHYSIVDERVEEVIVRSVYLLAIDCERQWFVSLQSIGPTENFEGFEKGSRRVAIEVAWKTFRKAVCYPWLGSCWVSFFVITVNEVNERRQNCEQALNTIWLLTTGTNFRLQVSTCLVISFSPIHTLPIYSFRQLIRPLPSTECRHTIKRMKFKQYKCFQELKSISSRGGRCTEHQFC